MRGQAGRQRSAPPPQYRAALLFLSGRLGHVCTIASLSPFFFVGTSIDCRSRKEAPPQHAVPSTACARRAVPRAALHAKGEQRQRQRQRRLVCCPSHGTVPRRCDPDGWLCRLACAGWGGCAAESGSGRAAGVPATAALCADTQGLQRPRCVRWSPLRKAEKEREREGRPALA